MLFDLNGNMTAYSKIQIEPYFSQQPLWAEQDPEYYWQMLSKACHSLWKQLSLDKNDIHGVVLTTQRNTVINLDKNGKPLRPAIVWLDKRRTLGLPPLGGIWGLIFKMAGLSKAAANFKADAKANWVYQNEPDIWKNTHKFLLLSGYLNFRLTGRYVDSGASQVGYLPFDYKKQRWASKYDWKWLLQPITMDMLPELIPCTQQLGQVSAEASESTGIPTGLPVFAAAGDKACEVLGAGCIEPSQGAISLGTSATLNICGKKYKELYHYLPPYPAAIPNRYNNEYQINRGYWLVNWFKEQFGSAEQQIAKEQNIAVESLFEDLIKGIPPGNLGLMLQPYWSVGLNVKHANGKGCLIGFGDIHHRGHIYKAILEGIAYELRLGKEILEKNSKIPIDELRASGGGSQSNEAMQITTDIMGMPISRLHTFETAGLGAAMDAAIGLKFFDSFDTAIKSMVRIKDTFYPRQEAQQINHELYTQVYKKLFNQLAPLYEEIQKITGYPPSSSTE